MKFFSIGTKHPNRGQECVFRKRPHYDKEFTYEYLHSWYDDERFGDGVFEWAPVPPHININPRGWKSEYRGDDPPDHNCGCLICTNKNSLVYYASYNTDLCKFLGHKEGTVLGFIEI